MSRVRRASWVLLVLLVPSSAQATAADIFGIGPRSQGVGGAGATLDIGSEAAFVNPATLARVRAPELTLGWHEARFSFDTNRPKATLPSSAEGGVFVGALIPLRIGDERMAFGIATLSPPDVVVRARLPLEETPTAALLFERARALDFTLGLGLALGDRWSLGLGLRVLASLSGGVRVVQDSAGRSTSVVENQLTPTYAPSMALRLDAGRGMRAALVARAPLRADFNVRVAAPSLGVVVLPDFDITGIAAYDPAEVHGEVSERLGPFTVLAALTYKRWRDFPGFLGATLSCPPVRPLCTALPASPANFHDTWVPRAAVTYAFELGPRALATARAGYFYEASPIPEQTGAANTWDNARHIVTVGYGVDLSRPLLPLRLDAALQWHQLVARTHHKDASIAPTNAGYPSVTVRGSALSFALSAGISF